MPIDLYNERPSNAYTNVSVIFGKLGDWDFTEFAIKIPCRRYLEFSQSGHLLFGEETSKWIKTMEKFFIGDWPDKSIGQSSSK